MDPPLSSHLDPHLEYALQWSDAIEDREQKKVNLHIADQKLQPVINKFVALDAKHNSLIVHQTAVFASQQNHTALMSRKQNICSPDEWAILLARDEYWVDQVDLATAAIDRLRREIALVFSKELPMEEKYFRHCTEELKQAIKVVEWLEGRVAEAMLATPKDREVQWRETGKTEVKTSQKENWKGADVRFDMAQGRVLGINRGKRIPRPPLGTGSL